MRILLLWLVMNRLLWWWLHGRGVDMVWLRARTGVYVVVAWRRGKVGGVVGAVVGGLVVGEVDVHDLRALAAAARALGGRRRAQWAAGARGASCGGARTAAAGRAVSERRGAEGRALAAVRCLGWLLLRQRLRLLWLLLLRLLWLGCWS